MGLRFRRSVRLFPGVRLNFSKSGISTTVGVRGAGLTFGPHGTYANVGLPGTGLSYRTKISGGASNRQHVDLPQTMVPAHFTPAISPLSTQNEQQIHSGAVSSMTSAGLGELKRLINEAALHRIALSETIRTDEICLTKAERKLGLANAFIIRLFTQGTIQRLTTQVEDNREQLEGHRAQLGGCHVNIDFGLDDAATGTFAAMCRSFEALRSSHKIWDITATAQIDRIKERTTATQRFSRTPVQFGFSQVDIILSNYQTMQMGNASGLEVHLYPGFLLTREPGSDFALIEWKDVSLQFSYSRFIEGEGMPNDSEIVGHTWAKANKDGSPDRRFNNNYQIPIAKYGELWLRSPTGLLEAYMVSNCTNAQNFATAVAQHKDTLEKLGDRLPQVPAEESEYVPDEELAPNQPEAHVVLQPAPHMYLDWMALLILVVAIGYAGYWLDMHRSALVRALHDTDAPVKTATISKATAPKETPPETLRPIAYIQKPIVNIRSAPSTSAHIVGKAAKGTKFNVFATKGPWTEVGDDKPSGWILSTLLGPIVH